MLPLCSKAWVNDNAETLDDATIKRLDANDTLARNGMRILGVAFRYIDSLPPGAGDREIEQQLTFVGMIGMIDPARRDVGTAVAICKKAGIRPVMVTGDHPLTARYIATELGIMTAEPYVTGSPIIPTLSFPNDKLKRFPCTRECHRNINSRSSKAFNAAATSWR